MSRLPIFIQRLLRGIGLQRWNRFARVKGDSHDTEDTYFTYLALTQCQGTDELYGIVCKQIQDPARHPQAAQVSQPSNSHHTKAMFTDLSRCDPYSTIQYYLANTALHLTAS